MPLRLYAHLTALYENDTLFEFRMLDPEHSENTAELEVPIPRRTARRLSANDFRFTSPLDNGIDRGTYFRICLPNSERDRSLRSR